MRVTKQHKMILETLASSVELGHWYLVVSDVGSYQNVSVVCVRCHRGLVTLTRAVGQNLLALPYLTRMDDPFTPEEREALTTARRCEDMPEFYQLAWCARALNLHLPDLHLPDLRLVDHHDVSNNPVPNPLCERKPSRIHDILVTRGALPQEQATTTGQTLDPWQLALYHQTQRAGQTTQPRWALDPATDPRTRYAGVLPTPTGQIWTKADQDAVNAIGYATEGQWRRQQLLAAKWGICPVCGWAATHAPKDKSCARCQERSARYRLPLDGQSDAGANNGGPPLDLRLGLPPVASAQPAPPVAPPVAPSVGPVITPLAV